MFVDYVTYKKAKTRKYQNKYKCLFNNNEWLLRDDCLSKAGTNGVIVIDKKQDAIIGYCFVNKSGLIFSLFVFPQYRLKGFAKKLMNKCINKYHGYCLKVEKDNYLAIYIYFKMGFRIRSEGLCYNSDGKKVPCFIMKKRK